MYAVRVGTQWAAWETDPIGQGGAAVCGVDERDTWDERWRAELLAREVGGVVVEVSE